MLVAEEAPRDLSFSFELGGIFGDSQVTHCGKLQTKGMSMEAIKSFCN
jgi:hypothetical protein